MPLPTTKNAVQRGVLFIVRKYILLYDQNVVIAAVTTQELKRKLFVMVIAFLENQER